MCRSLMCHRASVIASHAHLVRGWSSMLIFLVSVAHLLPLSHVVRGTVHGSSHGSVQVGLGVSTLLTYVPVSLGALHQANALVLFSAALALLHSLRSPLGAATPVARLFTPLAAAATVGVWAVVLRADEGATTPHPAVPH